MINISVLIRNKEQLDIINKYPIQSIYTDNYKLAMEFSNLFYQVPRNKNNSELPSNILVGDVGTLWAYKKDKLIVTDYFLNVANHKAIETLLIYNANKITLSIETTFQTIEHLLKIKDYPIEVIVYGRIEDMNLKEHPIFSENGYCLKDYQNNFYPIIVDENKNVRIFHSAPIDLISKIEELINIGVKNIRLDFFNEDEQEIKSILDMVVFQTQSI